MLVSYTHNYPLHRWNGKKAERPDAGSPQPGNGYYICSAENGNVPVPVTNH